MESAHQLLVDCLYAMAIYEYFLCLVTLFSFSVCLVFTLVIPCLGNVGYLAVWVFIMLMWSSFVNGANVMTIVVGCRELLQWGTAPFNGLW